MSAHSILQVKQQLLESSQYESYAIFEKLLQCKSSKQIVEQLEAYMNRTSEKTANG